MKKKIELNKKTIKRLNLKLEQKNDRKVAPAVIDELVEAEIRSKGMGCVNTNGGSCW